MAELEQVKRQARALQESTNQDPDRFGWQGDAMNLAIETETRPRQTTDNVAQKLTFRESQDQNYDTFNQH